YSTAIGVVLVATPLFFVGSFFEKTNGLVRFRHTETRWLVTIAGLLVVSVTVLISIFAIEAKASNAQLLWDLVGPPTTVLAQIESDSWRVDHHFNHSLSSIQRKTAAEKFKQVQGKVGSGSDPSISEFPDACLRIIKAVRLANQMIFLVEPNTDLNYAIFL